MSYNKLAADIHAMNVEKGFWPADKSTRNVGEMLCLMHSELSEAFEAYMTRANDDKLTHLPGYSVELIDAEIRALDLAGYYGFDLDSYAEQQHFLLDWLEDERLFYTPGVALSELLMMHNILSRALERHRKGNGPLVELVMFIGFLHMHCKGLGIDFADVRRQKLEYNAGRPFMHGKKY
jgi:hypothetical protein